jgi:hypothetical protein
MRKGVGAVSYKLFVFGIGTSAVVPMAAMVWSYRQITEAFEASGFRPRICVDKRHAKFEKTGNTPSSIIDWTLRAYVADFHRYADRPHLLWHPINASNQFTLRSVWGVESRRSIYRLILAKMNSCSGA